MSNEEKIRKAADWETIRAQFPVLQEWVYLNSATIGPVPACASAAIRRHLERRDERACTDFLDWFEDAERVRGQVARLVGAAADDVAFIPNTGTALSWLMNGIEWRRGDHILTLSDEFPNNLYFPKMLEASGVSVSEASLPEGRFSLEEFLEQLTSRTRLVLLSTVNYSTGLCTPVEKIGAALRERGVLFYVDGTQSVGALRLDVNQIQADVMAVHGYKWLLCPSGIGFVCIRPQVREWLEPSLYSWRSHRNWRDVDHLHHGRPELPESALKYEGGMQNFSGIFAMGAVVDLLESIGMTTIEQRIRELVEQVRETLRRLGGLLLHDRHAYYDSPVIAAAFPGVDVSKLARELSRRRIAVAARKGNLRVSPHFFNNESDVETLGHELARLLSQR